MRALHPGRFNGASLSTPGGELHVRLSDAGNWQLKVRSEQSSDWRLLCTGNLEGGLFAAAPDDESRPVSIGPLTVDPARRSVAVDGVAVTMTSREFDLLARLASDPRRVFPKKQLLREIWGYADACRTRTLDSHASKVRVKLRRAGLAGYVVNTRDVGYRLLSGAELESAAQVQLAA